MTGSALQKSETEVVAANGSVSACRHGTQDCEWGAQPHFVPAGPQTVGFPLCNIPDAITR